MRDRQSAVHIQVMRRTCGNMAALQSYANGLRRIPKEYVDQFPLGLRSSDIVITGYPKSGTTWLQQIVHQIRTGGDESFQDIYAVVKFLSRSDHLSNDPEIDQLFPRAYKTHELYETLTKGGEQPRFMVSFRNPYDSEYSFMKFVWRYIGFDQDMSTDEYKIVVKMRPVPEYARFIANWYGHRHDSDVLLVMYEDLKRNLVGCIQKISEFILGVPLKEPALSKVLHFCSFEYMSKNRSKFDGFKMWPQPWTEENGTNHSFLCTMVRQDGGQVGQGTAHLDEAMKRYIDEKWAEIIYGEFGLKNYQELYDHCTYFP